MTASEPAVEQPLDSRRPFGLARPMPDLSYLHQCPTRRDFAEALANEIVDAAMPDRQEFGDDDPWSPPAAYKRARRNGIALMRGALHIAQQVRDNYPGQDLDHMVVFNRWLDGYTALRALQRMRTDQLADEVTA